MKKNVYAFGIISGLILSLNMIYWIEQCYSKGDFSGSEIIGYASMLVVFSFIFIGVRNYRNKYNNGIISFGKAFKMGLFITLIASTFYVVTWLVYYYFFIPDFMEKYILYLVQDAKASGLTQTELDNKIAEMEGYKEMYKNPIFVVLLTYAEVVPVGLLVSLISAFILKRKTPKEFKTPGESVAA